MRQVGHPLPEELAARFADYLVTKGISSFVEQDGDGWVIWIRDEDHVEPSRDEFGAFAEQPDAEKYVQARREAEAIRRDEERQREQARRNVVEVRGRWKARGVRRNAPLVKVLVALSIGVSLFTGFGSRESSLTRRLLFADIHQPGGADATFDPLYDIKRGQVWRVFTPMFLHGRGEQGTGDLLHLVFNVYWLVFFGSQIEDTRGTFYFGMLVLFLAAASSFGQAMMVGSNFGGMSGVNYGLFGFVWMKTLFEPGSGLYVSGFVIVFMVVYFFLCMTPMIPSVANWAHGCGLGAGIVVGMARTLFRPSG